VESNITGSNSWGNRRNPYTGFQRHRRDEDKALGRPDDVQAHPYLPAGQETKQQ
jgi:hypothetical protein